MLQHAFSSQIVPLFNGADKQFDHSIFSRIKLIAVHFDVSGLLVSQMPKFRLRRGIFMPPYYNYYIKLLLLSLLNY